MPTENENQSAQVSGVPPPTACSMSSFDHAACLAVDPFEGDFGDGEVTLKDKIGIARKDNECHTCGKKIRKGQPIRIRTDRTDSGLETYRWCVTCCKAMARSERDDCRSWFARSEMRNRTSNPKCTGPEGNNAP